MKKKIKKFLRQLFCRHKHCWYSSSDPTLKTCHDCGKELVHHDFDTLN